MFRHLLIALPPALLLAVPLHADLTITSTTTGKGFGQSGSGKSVLQIKGLKMRTEQEAAGQNIVSILDVEGRQMILLDSKKKSADVYDMTQLATTQQQIAIDDVQVDLKPTGETRQIAGYSCDGYQIRTRVKMADPTGQGSMTAVLSGPTFLTKGAPGKDEFAAFYVAAVKAGLFFGSPELAKAQPGREKAMAELSRAMAEKGLGCSSELQFSFEGEGMMAAMMKNFSFTVSTNLESVSEAPLSDDLFKVPAGWKVKKK